MMTPRLVFKIGAAKAEHLIMGFLALHRPDGSSVSWQQVTSGIRRHQSASSAWTRNKGVLPESHLCAKPLVVMSEKQRSDNFSAVGEWLYSIWPNNIWSKDGKNKRSGCAVHLDANHSTSPGSAGCIVFVSNESWNSFMSEMDALNAAGFKEIQLEVYYI